MQTRIIQPTTQHINWLLFQLNVSHFQNLSRQVNVTRPCFLWNPISGRIGDLSKLPKELLSNSDDLQYWNFTTSSVNTDRIFCEMQCLPKSSSPLQDIHSPIWCWNFYVNGIKVLALRKSWVAGAPSEWKNINLG